MLKVFIYSLYQNYGYGAYHDIKGTVIANTESEALGFVLTHHPQFPADKFSINEIPLDSSGVFDYDHLTN